MHFEREVIKITKSNRAVFIIGPVLCILVMDMQVGQGPRWDDASKLFL